MAKLKNIIIASATALLVLIIVTFIINTNKNKSYIKVACAKQHIQEGTDISNESINWIRIESLNIDLNDYITESELNNYLDYVVNDNYEKGQIICKNTLTKKDEYLAQVEGLQYMALPIKSATEAVCYKLREGDRICVYYTAKKKLVDGILSGKKKVYSVGTSDTLVTCLLYEDIEIVAITNNLGNDANKSTVSDIVVRVNQEQALELANLKEQGVFTLALI